MAFNFPARLHSGLQNGLLVLSTWLHHQPLTSEHIFPLKMLFLLFLPDMENDAIFYAIAKRRTWGHLRLITIHSYVPRNHTVLSIPSRQLLNIPAPFTQLMASPHHHSLGPPQQTNWFPSVRSPPFPAYSHNSARLIILMPSSNHVISLLRISFLISFAYRIYSKCLLVIYKFVQDLSLLDSLSFSFQMTFPFRCTFYPSRTRSQTPQPQQMCVCSTKYTILSYTPHITSFTRNAHPSSILVNFSSSYKFS